MNVPVLPTTVILTTLGCVLLTTATIHNADHLKPVLKKELRAMVRDKVTEAFTYEMNNTGGDE